jgi:CRISPR/Cas system-associated exonuclease Cas4 (RecB family)
MIEFELPQHVSHSAISSYLRCSKAYELGKLGVPELPAWWLIGGSAVHKATEWLDKGEWDGSPEMAFYTAFNNEIFDAVDTEPDQDKWRKAGYGARAQGYDHWMRQGADYVRQWADKDTRWVHVELDVSLELPSGILVRGYIDRVAHKGFDSFAIYDLKTGSTRPDSDQQLGIYKVLFEQKYETEVTGAYNYMFRDDEFYPMDVSNWTLETVDEIAKEWYDGISSGVFIPNRGKQCGTCGLSAACYLNSGDTPQTRKYDRLNPNFGDTFE